LIPRFDGEIHSLEQIAQAQEDFSNKGHAGKIVLIPLQ
jgi:hypothetical protein